MTRLAALCAAALSSGSVLADQILVIDDATLTTYVATAKSGIQVIRPLVDQRGLGIDGYAYQPVGGGGLPPPGSFGAGPCYNGPWTVSLPQPDGGIGGNRRFQNIDLFAGTYMINDVDLSLPAEIPWVVGRSYNARQKDSGGSYYASSGYQGMNWFQSSQPELVFHDSQTDSEDVVYLVYGADRFIELIRADDQGSPSADTFRAVNGATGALLLHTFDGVDLATYYDPAGNRVDFFWFGDADVDDDIEGSIWRIMDPTIEVDPYDTGDRLVTSDGNVAYVGDVGNPNTALSSYDASTGAIVTAYDSAGRRFTYTYTSGMLTEVKAEVNSGSWTEVGKVQYAYYVNADSHGEDDDLELVTITMPLTDSGVSQVRKKHYWYYEGTYHATNNPGYHHQLKYVIDFEGYRGYDWDTNGTLDDDTLSASEANLKAYASASFAYDTERRIVSAWFNGACGCSGAASGTHTFEYEGNTGFFGGSGYQSGWKTRTIVEKPDVRYELSEDPITGFLTQYFDETGQPLHRVQSLKHPDVTASQEIWATEVVRSSSGQVTAIHSPANVTAYSSPGGFTTSTTAGLVTTFTRETSGDTTGFVLDTKHKEGTSGSAYLDGTLTYSTQTLTVGDFGLTRPLVASRRVYTQEITSGTTGSHLTSFSHSFHGGSSTAVQYLAPKQITTTNPAVSASNNGSGSSTTTKGYLRLDGSTAFTESAGGIFTYTKLTDGQLTMRIDDVDLTNGDVNGTADDPSGVWSITEVSGGVHRKTHQFTLAVDDDTAYADADDVTGDIVLQERQSVYESTDGDDMVMQAVIDRFHDDKGASETTGPLDTNADGDDLLYTAANIEGRIQITAMWHDRFGRVIDTVRYGTNGGSSFDRDGLGAPTSPSDTELLTETEYGTDGTILQIIDPRELTTRFEYDDAGRQAKVIRNYVDGTPSGDSDQTITYEYTDGLRTKYIADLPATETDQQTLYTYGTTKGVSAGDSKIATGHLLQKVQYPDSAGGTDVVTFAYNAQSQQIWTQDQAGNVIETDFDDFGREIHRRATTIDTGGGFDDAVQRISTTYDSLGRRCLPVCPLWSGSILLRQLG